MQNPPSRKPQPIEVACRSGRSYADRPTSLVWNGERYEIAEIESEWLEPGEKHFVVRATTASQDEKRCHICYDSREDTWQLKETQ